MGGHDRDIIKNPCFRQRPIWVGSNMCMVVDQAPPAAAAAAAAPPEATTIAITTPQLCHLLLQLFYKKSETTVAVVAVRASPLHQQKQKQPFTQSRI
jgi:hypothetical protein